MTWTLLASGAASLAAASVFAWTGAWFLARAKASDERAALRSFAAWWLGLGAYTAFRGAEDTLAGAGVLPFEAYVAMRYASLPVLCAALAGLAYYVLYLRSGRRAWAWPVALYYGALAAGFVAVVVASRPIDIAVERWRTDLVYARPLTGALLQVVLLLIIAPLAAAAAALLALARRVEDAAARRRMRIVGASLLVYLLAAFAARALQSDLGQLVARPLLGLAVAAAVVVAYRPQWSTGARTLSARRWEAEAALQARVRDLV